MARRCCSLLTSATGLPFATLPTAARVPPSGHHQSPRCRPCRPTDGYGWPRPQSTKVQTLEWRAGAASELGSTEPDDLALPLPGCPTLPFFPLRSSSSPYEPCRPTPILFSP